jgi:hypothetical protein
MAKKKTIKTKARSPRSRETHMLECKVCGTPSERNIEVVAYTCWECVNEMCATSVLPKPKRPAGFLRGWKFMKVFVHENGTVYHKGVEQPNLKDTLPATPRKETKKDARTKTQKARDRQTTLVQISKLKKEIQKEKRITYKRKLETKLKTLIKQL